jgi:cytochrome c553
MLALACLAGLLASCRGTGDGPANVPSAHGPGLDLAAARTGQAIFRNAHFGPVGIACADCHADYEDRLQPHDRLLPGHSIVGAAGRQLAWNGMFRGESFRRAAAGAAMCAKLYQRRAATVDAALSAEEADALFAFFKAISAGSEQSQLPWTAVTFPGDTTVSKETLVRLTEPIWKLRGNADRGETTYARACAFCHARGAHSSGPSLKAQKKALPDVPLVIRAGMGAMPFFSRDKLSDTDIADLLAYIDRNG